jgi:hypothetical protein
VWLFLALATVGNWSGDWLIGGVEGKVLAYGCLFLAWSQAMESHWRRGAVAMGAAIAFHPVVGMWGLLATLGALLWSSFRRDAEGSAFVPRETALRSGSRRKGATAALIVAVVALPGLIPVARIMLEPVDPATRFAGNYIQVYYRLAHHLDPMTFPWRAHCGAAALALGWLIGWKAGPRGAGWNWLHRLTAWSLAFALVGLAIGFGPRPPQEMPGYEWRMFLLKFYPFRLADVLLPLMVSLLAASWIAARGPLGRRLNAQGALLAVVIAGTLAGAAFGTQHQRYQRAHHADWVDACRWIRDHAPPNAVVIPPHGQWTFKWHGERPEYVNFKDCPQDVRGIVEWNRRQRVLTRWYQKAFEDDARYSSAELRELRRQTRADYLIVQDVGPFESAPVYRNATHRVYDLRVD